VPEKVVSAVVFDGVMVPVPYVGVSKDTGRRAVAQQREHERRESTAREQALVAQGDQTQLVLQTSVNTV
jgi:hypothetical protein